MKLTSTLVFLGLVAAAHAVNQYFPFQDGQEYEYKSWITSSAGTMDVATHSSGEQYRMKVKIQMHGNKMNVKISNLERSMYVGGHLPTEDRFAKTTFIKVPQAELAFSIDLDNNGLFKKLTMDSGLLAFQKNVIKGWAAQLQINTGEVKKGHMAFKSQEKSLHGDCEVSYVVSPDQLIKSVSHMADCKNRKYRFVDDFRGYQCDMDWSEPQKKVSTDGLFSSATSLYKYKKTGGSYVVTGMSTSSSLVAQMYETEGMSHYAHVNVTSVLINQQSSAGDISASGESVTDLAYEFGDADLKWNKNRDLKAREPFFSSGNFYEDDQNTLKAGLLKTLNYIYDSRHAHGTDQATIQKKHKHALETVFFLMYAMDYSTLKGIADELWLVKNEKGIWMSNMFYEYLGTTGTTASALVVRDIIMENKYDNDRDAARMLTAVPFHIRRPNTQLVAEYEKLLTVQSDRFLKMSIPLTFSHLVKMVCKRAGPPGSPDQLECWKSFAAKHVTNFYQKFKAASNRDDKNVAMEALHNIRFGGTSIKLKDVIHGKTNDDSEYRVAAIWAAGWEGVIREGVDYFFPVFANQKDSHEVRIAALAMIFYCQPSTTDLGRILAVLKTETDYEVINMAYSLFEQWANTIDPCQKETGEKARFFLKYMKQYSQYETNWGFGVSKSFIREYQQKKYGYGGAYHYWVIGSHQSTTPISVGMGITNTFFHSYTSDRLWVSLRIEGLAKGLIRKFKVMDPSTWKIEDLSNILFNEMNIREREDQPVRVKITVNLKGSIVFSRSYDEGDAKQGGKMAKFFEGISSMGDDYMINHQRLLNLGSMLYEQPSDIGLPLVYISSMSASLQLNANVKRGNHRGLIFRNLDYDLSILANGHDGMLVINPMRKMSYAIFQSRIYHFHVPRKLVIGVNPIRKEFKLSISRPAYNDPAFSLMHAQTMVTVKGSKIGQEVADLKKHCPTCENRVIVSRGPGAAVSRVVRDIDNEEFGYQNHMEYFDCEMDIAQSNTISRAILAFMPFNKNPKTASISLGLRQIAAYIALYPRAERCGIYTRWSQSQTNPTTEYELTARASVDENGSRMFFRGRKIAVKAILKANGQPETRAYRLSVNVETSPGSLENKIKVQFNRAPVASLGISPYTVCASYDSKYPDFAKEFLSMDMNQPMAVSGAALVKYGEGTECDQGDGEIKVSFKHQTTEEGYQALAKKWYYKKCMAQKNSAEWKARGGNKLPATEPCYMALWDGTSARHYSWKMDFVKLTNRMKNIIGTVRTVAKTMLIPYLDEDFQLSDDSNGDVGPYLNVDVTFKNSDKNADIRVETSQGVREYEDYPLKLEWTKRLRNMKLTRTIKRLIDAKVIYPCVATVGSVQTNDNVTYAYNAGSCWTLTSAKCGPNPAYAVFTKKVGSKLAVRAYFGGHFVEIENGAVKINGNPKSLTEGVEEAFKNDETEIFKIVKWGSTVNVYSFLNVWLATDNVFVQVMPSPSTRGQHCGLCGTYNRNIYDEFLGKDGKTMMKSPAAMVNEWKWKC